MPSMRAPTLHGASSESLRADSSDGLEAGVERDEQIPHRSSEGKGYGFNDAAFELRNAHAFPQFVGQRDEELLEGTLELGPLCVRSAATGDVGGDSAAQQQRLAGRLVLGARLRELGRMHDLAGVVQGGAREHPAGVRLEAMRAAEGQQGDCGFAHQLGMYPEGAGERPARAGARGPRRYR